MAVTLTTSYQLIGSAWQGSSYGCNYYQGIYAKYSRTESQRLNRKSTLYIKVAGYTDQSSSAYSAYGYWLGNFNGALTNGWYVSATVTGGSTTTLYETSFEVTHDSSGNYSTTIGATNVDSPLANSVATTISSVTLTMPRIILNPSISISGAGSSTSNYLTMSANTSMSVVLSDTNSVSTTIKLTYSDSTEYTLATKSADGTYSVTVPISLWNKYTSADTAVITLSAVNTNGTGTTSCYVKLADSIVPTASMSVSAVNSISALGSNYVKNLSQVRIVMTGTGVYSSTVNRAGSNISDSTITNVLLATDRFTRTLDLTYSGTFYVAGKVMDSRNRSSELQSTTKTAIDYYEPYLTWSVARCTSAGVLDEEGTYAKITATYDIAPINNGSSSLNTKALEYSTNGTTWTAISLSSYATTITQVIGGSFATTSKYTIYIRISDIAKTTTYTAELSPSFTTVSLRDGGGGVTIGQVATDDEFHCYMETHLHDGLYIGSTLILYDDGN